MAKEKVDVSVKSQVIIGITVALVTIIANLASDWIRLGIDSRRQQIMSQQARKEREYDCALRDLTQLISLYHQMEHPVSILLTGKSGVSAGSVYGADIFAPTGTPEVVLMGLAQTATSLCEELSQRHQIKIHPDVILVANGALMIGYGTFSSKLINKPLHSLTNIPPGVCWLPASLTTIPPENPGIKLNPQMPYPANYEFLPKMKEVEALLEDARQSLINTQ